MREKVGMKVVRALKRNDDGVTHASIDMLGALMQVNSIVSSLCMSQVGLQKSNFTCMCIPI